MKIEIGYPNVDEEAKIVELVRNENKGDTKRINPIDPKVIFDSRKEINDIEVTQAAQKYMVDLVSATRYPDKFDKDLARWISYGGSPRATIALDKCSRVVAWLDGRTSVTPDDIRYIVHDVLRHRLILSYEANADRVNANKVIDTILKNVAVM